MKGKKVYHATIARQYSDRISNNKGTVCLVLDVPRIRNSNSFEGCKIINITYFLYFHAYLAGLRLVEHVTNMVNPNKFVIFQEFRRPPEI